MHKELQQRVKAWESTVRKMHLQGGRRRGCIFSATSVAPEDDGESAEPSGVADGDACRVERLLPDGDFYSGDWSGGMPHGAGKYLWTDGCMYEGEWRGGRTSGRGRFSWPCGATYEGEFKSGFMDGVGTYTGSSGDTYRGGWSMNLRHGRGRKSYANGDHYDGEWRAGVQEGNGRYSWSNGNEYVGQWRGGLMHGRGVLVWLGGERYDGAWEDGEPRGSGSFRWADGSLYVGVWSRDEGSGELQQKGVYYPGTMAASPAAKDTLEVFDVMLRQCKVCQDEMMPVPPSQKMINLPGDGKQRRRASADGAGTVVRRPNGRTKTMVGLDNGCKWETDEDVASQSTERSGNVSGEMVGRSSGRGSAPTLWAGREMKKQGVTISKGHKNYELMLNLQLGIRHAVGKQAPAASFDLKASAFDPKEKVWTRFPPEGSKHTPPHQSCDFRWKDYCPKVFRMLRSLFKVDTADYMLSICGNDALRELSSPGKSGSFFYLTNDDRYMIKTVKKAEVKVLLKMLPAYYNHVRSYENTLVTKFYGLHCVKVTGSNQKKVRFVIMGNLCCTEYAIHRRYDLKGSSHGRTTDKPDVEIDENTTLKDLDLSFIFRLQKFWFQEFQRQVDKDCEFLEQEKIMDYSLLVGIHFRETLSNDVLSNDSYSQTSTSSSDHGKSSDSSPRLPRPDKDHCLSHPNRRVTIRLGTNMPAKVVHIARRNDCESQLIGEPTGEFYHVILFFGIIDILQDYDISKKLEHAYKSIQYDSTSISAVDPKLYAKRFKDFMHRAFIEDS
ncbi:hypothetical protein J5N97_018133 [Dioscorea zingiberensis]|uniref:Phosphatidylinositol 4-phosphate 5-kinase n=1 Tax=Dioscorea zingiberensis TaxID=325984 RepID=A0A9D5CMA9_9LILI|nr:hypothetical protein J5N97_018133 [Dioscorea zingiberensis]